MEFHAAGMHINKLCCEIINNRVVNTSIIGYS